MERFFESDDSGYLDLNIIAKSFNLKLPSQWRNKERRALEDASKIVFWKGGLHSGGYANADKEATICYAMWCGLPVEDHVTVITERPESTFKGYLEQIFSKVESQKSYQDGKYFVDFYIPLLDLNIEYDEKYHRYSKKEDALRELEIGGDFFRVDEGDEVSAILALKDLKLAKRKDTKVSPTYWCVASKYYFEKEISAWKFAIKTGTEVVRFVGKVEGYLVEQKFINADKTYPDVLFPLVIAEKDYTPF